MKASGKEPKIRSLKKTIQISYIFLIGIMIIPTIYSVVVLQIHTKQYDDIITNVSKANSINQIAKNDLPNWLWEIVCGKKDFENDSPYGMIGQMFDGIADMQTHTKSPVNKQKLEVAYRACTTLDNNIRMLENQMFMGSSVTANEMSLDEIRTITSLFSDTTGVMQIHLRMKRQDVFGIFAFTRPLLFEFSEVFRQRGHDRDVHADLRLAHFPSADDEVFQINFTPLQRANVTFTKRR